MKIFFALILCSAAFFPGLSRAQSQTVVHNVTVVDGFGGPSKPNQDVIITGERITAIRPAAAVVPETATVIDGTGKTMMPPIFDCHAHLGLLQDTTTAAAHYTEANIRRHLLLLESYGVEAVMSMGTDREIILALRDSSRAGSLPGATIYSAIYGFGVPGGAPPAAAGMDHVFRPATPEEARADVQKLAKLKPDLVKIWVDDFFGSVPKMKPEIARAIIDECHRWGIRVAAHLFYLADARWLVDAGLDVIAHSIRDSVVDDALLAQMKKKHVTYIPTLALDEFAFAYADDPPWLNDPFFRNALEPGVYEMITRPAYKEKLKTSGVSDREMKVLSVALKNIKRIFDAGVPVCLGTDAGAQPIRVLGFSEHMEMALMVQAGIPPAAAVRIATLNGARLLGADGNNGTIEKAKKASFLLLDGDPTLDISATRRIVSVWRDGRPVAGPAAGRQ